MNKFERHHVSLEFKVTNQEKKKRKQTRLHLCNMSGSRFELNETCTQNIIYLTQSISSAKGVGVILRRL